MRSVYRGTLRDVTEGGEDLPVSIILDNAWMDIISQDRTLGRWPLDQVSAERRVANRFNLIVAGEEWDFACDEPADFAIEGVEHIAGYRPPRRPGWMARLRDQTGTLGRWALTSAIVVLGFGVGLIMGRYRLDGENLYTAIALAGFLVLSLVLTRVLTAEPGTATPPSVTERNTQHHRSPLRVEELMAAPSPIERARRRATGPEGESETAPSSMPAADDTAPNLDRAVERSWRFALPQPGTPTDGHPGEQVRSEEQATDPGRDEPVGTGTGAEPVPVDSAASGRESMIGEPDEVSETDLDLATINGIGPVFAELLHDLGVDDVRALAQLDEPGIARIVEKLGRFGKRLYTADWVGQARRRLGLAREHSKIREEKSVGQTGFGHGAAP